MTRQHATERHRVRWRVVTVLLLTAMAGSGIAGERVWVPALPSFLTSPEIAVASGAGRTLVVDHEMALMAEGSGPWYRLPWRPGSPPHEAIWAGDRFVVRFGDGLAWSADGTSWAHSELPESFQHGRLLWTGDALLLIEHDGATWRSDNRGRTWRSWTGPLGRSSIGPFGVGKETVAVRDAAVGDGVVVLVGDRSVGRPFTSRCGAVYVSTAGEDGFERVLCSEDSDLDSVVWTPDGFVAIGDNDTVAHSPDGVVWSVHQATGVDPWDIHFGGLAWTRQGLFATAMQITDTGDVPLSPVYRSSDGLHWTRGTDERPRLNALEPTAAGVLAVGRGAVYRFEGSDVWRTVLETAYPVRFAHSSGRAVVVGPSIEQMSTFTPNFGSILVAIDGLRFEHGLSPAWPQDWRYLQGWPWPGFTGLAGSPDGFVATLGAYAIAFWDGATDRWGLIGFDHRNADSVAWGGGRFVTAGRVGAAWSADGRSWAEVTTDESLKAEAVAYGNGRFVAVGEGVFWSGSGTQWWRSESAGDVRLEDVLWTGSEFVAVGHAGTVMCSADGDTWSDEPHFTSQTLEAVFLFDGHAHVTVGGTLWRRDEGGWTIQDPPPGLTTLADAMVFEGRPVVVGAASDADPRYPRQQLMVAVDETELTRKWAVTGLERGRAYDGSFSTSRIALYNPNESTVACRLTRLGAMDSLVLPVAPKSRVAINAVLERLGVAEGASTVLIEANGLLQSSAAVSSVIGDGSVLTSLRRDVPVEPAERWLVPGDARVVVAAADPLMRLRLALANTGTADASVLLREYGRQGAELSQQLIVMRAAETRLAAATDSETAWIEARVVGEDLSARVLVAGWIEDQFSGDTAAAGPYEPMSVRTTVPAVAHLRSWRSVVTVVNPGPTEAIYRLELHPRWGSGPPQTATFALAPGVAARYTDVVSDPFDGFGGAALTVVPVEGRIAVASWSVSEEGGGRVWQATAPQPAVSLAPDRPVVLSGLESWASGRRSNLAITSMSDEATVVDVVLRDAGGAELDRRRLNLPGHGHVQLDRVFTGVAPYGVSGGSAEIAARGGSLVVAAFVVDQRTNDGLTVTAAVASVPGSVPRFCR